LSRNASAALAPASPPPTMANVAEDVMSAEPTRRGRASGRCVPPAQRQQMMTRARRVVRCQRELSHRRCMLLHNVNK
jgi:hypothetical protein